MANIGSVQQVGRVQEFQRAALDEQLVRRRVELHTNDSMERVRTIKGEGVNLSLPAGNAEQEQVLRSAYSNASPEQQEALVTASYQLASGLYGMAGGLSASASGLQQATQQSMELYVATTGERNIEQMTTGVISMALDGVDGDVRDLANQLKGALDMAKSYREDISDFRNTLSEWPEGKATQTFEWIEFDEFGKAQKMGPVEMTKEQAKAKMEELEGKLTTVGDMKQEWQLQLQDAMNKQQQAFQMLSGIMKSFHDTAKQILQNLKA